MKKILLFLALMFLPMLASSQIVNNSGTTAADSVSIPFYMLDSTGNIVRLIDVGTLGRDSIFVYFFRPNGALAFRDSLISTDTRVTTQIQGTDTFYVFSDQVSDLDGAGVDGVYSYLLIAERDSLMSLTTPHKGFFQLYQNNDFNVWATRLQDSLQTALDSVTAILDSIQNKTNWTIFDVSDSVIVDGSALAATADAITATTIGFSAITDQEIGSNAIGSLELSTDAINEIWNTSQVGGSWNNGTFAKFLDTTVSSRLGGGPSGTPLTLADSTKYMNVKSIAGEANITSANNLGEAWDDDGTGSELELKQFRVIATTAEDTAVKFVGADGGQGLFLKGGPTNGFGMKAIGEGAGGGVQAGSLGTGNGVEMVGGSTSGSGLYITTNSGDGARIEAIGGKGASIIAGTGNNTGLHIQGSGTGNALGLSTGTGDLIQDSAINIGTLTTAARRHIAAYVADTGQSLNWDSAGGGGGATDSGLVARIGKRIWGVAQGAGSDSLTVAQRTVASRGGWVDSNKTEQGGIAGANRTWNVYVFDTSGTDTPIPSANVDVQLTNGVVKLRGTTVASGLVTFTVTDGSWVLVSQETGYILNNLSKSISGNSTDTVKGYDLIVGAPSSPTLCRVYGYVNSIEAVPDEGAGVAAYLPAGVARSGNLIISPFAVSTVTDSMGYFYLDLIRSDSLLPAGTMYDLVINRKDGTIVHKRVTVPDQSSWLLQW